MGVLHDGPSGPTGFVAVWVSPERLEEVAAQTSR